MSLLDTILGTFSGKGESGQPDANPLLSALGGLIAKNGGVEGLMRQFSKGGLGEVFASWVGAGQNQSLSPDQVTAALGADQVSEVASKLGIDTGKASSLLAEYLPGVIDKLTPKGAIDPDADPMKGLADLVPSLLKGGVGEFLGGGGPKQA